MSIIVSLFLIGISLSMDTFSISLSLGTLNISKRKIIFFSLLVGIMHFFMPLFGNILGKRIVMFLSVNVNLLLGIILLFIGIEMLIDLFKKDTKKFTLNLLNIFLISVSVSLDSFSTGIGLTAITNDIILSSIIFSTCATVFTFIGLIIGKYSEEKLGIYGNIIGVILLIAIGIWHIFK